MQREFIIQPNCSLDDHGRRTFFLALAIVMFLIAALLAARGLWLVTPFMGADLLLVIYAFRQVKAHCNIIERVVITGNELTIHHEEKGCPCSWSFPLYWVTVNLRQAPHPTRNSRLLIGTHGKWVELATFINEDERVSLASAIKSAIISARQPDWAKGVIL